MFNDDFNNWDSTKSYKTVEILIRKLSEYEIDFRNSRPLIVKIPNGKNVDRYTAVFPLYGPNNEHQIYWIHRGFKVMGLQIFDRSIIIY